MQLWTAQMTVGSTELDFHSGESKLAAFKYGFEPSKMFSNGKLTWDTGATIGGKDWSKVLFALSAQFKMYRAEDSEENYL